MLRFVEIKISRFCDILYCELLLGNNDNNLQTSRRSREDWVELVHMTRQLLTGDVAECLSVCFVFF